LAAKLSDFPRKKEEIPKGHWTRLVGVGKKEACGGGKMSDENAEFLRGGAMLK